MAKGDMPEKRFVAGSVSATVWKNVAEKNGKDIEFRTISCVRNYKSEKGWQRTSSFRLQDVADLMLVLGKAYSFIRLKSGGEAGEEDE